MEKLPMNIEMSELQAFDKAVKPYLDNFMEKLNADPNTKAIKKNPFANNAKYIPIEILESALDSIFRGLWKVENVKYSVELNSIVVSLDLSVFHPISMIWITRSGIGAMPIEQDKKTKELNNKALHKNVPAAKSFAFRNAVQSLGRRFGRNLNRDMDFSFKADTSNFDQTFNTTSDEN